MLVRVMYQDEKYDMVQPRLLNFLISSKKIRKFSRSGGWAHIETAPIRGIRGSGGSYIGPDRRAATRVSEMQGQ